MNLELRPTYRLVMRGECGLACDDDGLALGALSLARAHRGAGGARRCIVRPTHEIDAILRKIYGPQPMGTVLRLHRGLRRAAAFIEAGDLGRAGVEALMLGLPELTPATMVKLDEIADLEKRGAAWQTEPRIPAGQAGGGQWTTGEGAAGVVDRKPARVGTPHQQPVSPRSPVSPCDPPVDWASSSGARDLAAYERSLRIPISTATAALDGYSSGQDFALPENVAGLGRAGLLAYAASLLDRWDAGAAQEQVANAIKRFGLNPNRPADVIAASAYVWSKYQLPLIPKVPATGPGLEAASKAVMRFVMIQPGAFTSMNRISANRIVAAALGGLSDLNLESSARRQGVDPALQTRSESARAAIAIHLLSGAWQAHHLVPIMTIGRYAYIFNLAIKDGWKTNLATNLIALPKDASTQLSADEILPIHNGNHRNYNNDTLRRIMIVRGAYPEHLTDVDAYAILEFVANWNRAIILSGYYNPAMKVYQ